MSEFFKTNTTRIAQLCYKDSATDNWIPITEANPLPIGTPTGFPLNIRIIGDTGQAADVVLQPDGTYALRVDSEMTLNVDTVSIGNIKVGSDSVNDTKLLTTSTGLLKIVDANGNAVTDIRQLTTADKISIHGSDDGITARLIKTISDGSVVTQAQLTFRNPLTQQPIYVSEDTPLPTGPLLTLGGTLVKNVVDTSSYNLQTAPYIISTNINTDYILDNVELKFSTAEVKTITITSDSSAILWGGTLNSSPSNAGYDTKGKHFQLSFNQAFNANENININVTQTTNACLLDCTVRIKTGVDSLMGNPSAAVYMIDPLGNPYGVKHVENKIRTSSVDYTYDVAAGNIPNHSIFRCFGERENIAVVTNGSDVWKGALSSIPIPTLSGEQMSVVSTSTQDSSAGTGVQKVSVHYLNGTGDEGVEIVTLNGTTPVNLTLLTISFVNDFHATQVGNNTVAVGTISIYKTSDVTRIYSAINIGTNFALTCSKKVPTGKRFF